MSTLSRGVALAPCPATRPRRPAPYGNTDSFRLAADVQFWWPAGRSRRQPSFACPRADWPLHIQDQTLGGTRPFDAWSPTPHADQWQFWTASSWRYRPRCRHRVRRL